METQTCFMSYPTVDKCESIGRDNDTVVADLDGTLLRGRSSFPYFAIVAFEAGGIFRLLFLLLVSPLAGFLYYFISESVGIQVLVFASFTGLKIFDIDSVAKAVLVKFYSEDLHPESWRVFSSCGRRCVLTANPTVMVEPFLKDYLGADVVVGTEIGVWRGRATGFVKKPGVLVGEKKASALKEVFGEWSPQIGIGDRRTDLPFLKLCQESYIVPKKPAVEAVTRDKLPKPIIFHDGRLVQKPTPLLALFIILWFPFGFFLACFRVAAGSLLPARFVYHGVRALGIRVTIKGTPPPPPPTQKSTAQSGVLFICSHRTLLDPLTDEIVPVAMVNKMSMFHGTTARGWKGMDPFYFLMNPRPAYEVTFLDKLPCELTCGGGGRSSHDVANHIQRLIAVCLSYECTSFTGKDKYKALAGNDGTVVKKYKA
ncbi:Glycerol-3-phosphate 2-O-acyltransferase 4 [Acorus calamus]|uniref:Glycerol-3-phosphate acyltransferase RAM2 n=1 Tax=Acorus calamus TaxID=4465 RepID=A0AAV9E1K9_ACOCL|nr:Glycerol-3-phosphate 2-O-acyltransferase 4 [Acorus calamus]